MCHDLVSRLDELQKHERRGGLQTAIGTPRIHVKAAYATPWVIKVPHKGDDSRMRSCQRKPIMVNKRMDTSNATAAKVLQQCLSSQFGTTRTCDEEGKESVLHGTLGDKASIRFFGPCTLVAVNTHCRGTRQSRYCSTVPPLTHRRLRMRHVRSTRTQ